ncbi:MAG: hypothetical protein DHS20C16_13650 [Phycisphaerae bacterium]|nr:MAG: hypothetical protein DHS20C16_13650 [Phycisphaerae bacterium]
MKKCLVCGIAAIFSANVAMADYTILPADLPADTAGIGNLAAGHLEVDINGAVIPAGTYTGYSVSFDWTDATNAWSNEAVVAFADNDLANFVVQYSGATADNAAADGNPVTLTYDGFFDVAYEGGDPLWFISWETYAGASFNLANVAITLTQGAPVSPFASLALQGVLNGPVDSASGDTTGAADQVAGGAGPGAGSANYFSGDHTYQLNWGGGDINIDSLFTNANGDIDLFLYDDTPGAGLVASGTSVDDNENINLVGLAAGTYYIVIDGWQGAENAYQLNVTPEPASIALLAMGAAVVVRRRRR